MSLGNLRIKYRQIVQALANGEELDEEDVFAVTTELGITEQMLEDDVARLNPRCAELLNTVKEALSIAEANSGLGCPLSSDACGECFEKIRDLLRKIV